MSSARIVLRPLGNPLPLAFFALAAGTFTLSALQLGWIPADEGDQVALVLVAFVFPLQLLAAILAFLARDGSTGAGLGLVAGGWLVIGLETLASPAGATSTALGVFLLALSPQLLAPVLSAAPTKALAAAVVGGTALRFALTGVYELTGSGGWEEVAGIAGLALFALAAYGGLAFELADARRPVESDPAEDVEREPGVRPLL